VVQISAYEAIQPIRSLTELRRRVGPYRRCYCLTHGALPREPLIVVHAALTTLISRTIQVRSAIADSLQVASALSDCFVVLRPPHIHTRLTALCARDYPGEPVQER